MDEDESKPLLEGETSGKIQEDDQSVEVKLRDFQLIRVPRERSFFSFRKLWAFTGPGFLMSIAYLDPGNIESDLQAGAVAEYRLLWVLLSSTVVGLVLQLLSAKLGVVTGKHLAEVCHDEYPFVPRIVLWLCMELAIIGSDIQEVIGSALAIHILSQGTIPLWEGCLITAVDTFTFLFLESYGLRYLEAFFGSLILVMVGMFGWMYIYAGPIQKDVVKGVFIPWCEGCDSSAAEQGLGIVGAIIMPHNLYLHSGLVLSRAISRSSTTEVKEGIKYNSIESSIALFVSFLINLFVICVFGAGVYNFSEVPGFIPREIREECNSTNISLLYAHECLYYAYGRRPWIKYIWAIGLLAAGQSSTMTGTYAGQFVMEGFLNIKWEKWKRVLLTRSVAMVPCVIIAVLASNSLDYLDEYINVEQSLLLPFALVPILHVTSSRRIMGQFKNSLTWTIVVWIMGIVVMGVNIYFIVFQVAIPGKWWRHLVASFGLFIYLAVVGFYVFYPLYKNYMDMHMSTKKKSTI